MPHKSWDQQELDKKVSAVEYYIEKQKAAGSIRFWIELAASFLDLKHYEVLAAFAVLASQGKIENHIRAICNDGRARSVVADVPFSAGFPTGKCRSCGKELSGANEHSFDFYACLPEKKKATRKRRTPQTKCKWCGKLIDQGEVLCSMCSEAGHP